MEWLSVCGALPLNNSLITNTLYLASDFIVRKYYLSAALPGLLNVTHIVCSTSWQVS